MKTISLVNIANRTGGLLAVIALTACVPTTPILDANFGNAVEMSKATQTINPDASSNVDPVQGIDGQAGDAIVDNYRNSFRSPPNAAGSVINVGTTGAGSTSGGSNSGGN